MGDARLTVSGDAQAPVAVSSLHALEASGYAHVNRRGPNLEVYSRRNDLRRVAARRSTDDHD